MRKNKLLFVILLQLFAISVVAQPGAVSNGSTKIIQYGTAIDPEKQVMESQDLALQLNQQYTVNWKKKGDQKRNYYDQVIGIEMPYRIFVPTKWDGKSELPLVMFLHGAWSNEGTYLEANDKQMMRLANKHGYILVSPMGYTSLGAYGTCLKLPAVFGKPEEATKLIEAQTPDQWDKLEKSERDVINVLELVLSEYPVDRSHMFLMGHSMGSGGAWYLGAKYNMYWKALAPISGPFVSKDLYPWERIKNMPVFITEGIKALPSLEASRALADWMKDNGFKVEYKEVNEDHAGMVSMVLPEIFEFFDRCRVE